MANSLKFLIIVDLEATCWEHGFNKSFKEMETIEIGAVKIDIEKSTPIDEFDLFVRPVNNPQLSEFCTNLTSIVQKDVDKAETFPSAFQSYLDWIGPTEESYMSSWGWYDLYQFRMDCRRNKIVYPFEKRHLNIKELCKRALKQKRFGLSFALKKLGLEFEGTHHRGIDDARNIWRIVQKVSNGNVKGLLENKLTEQGDLFERDKYSI